MFGIYKTWGGMMATKIIIGDSLAELPKFEDNSIDCILTSPPFKDEDVKEDYWKFYDTIFNEMVRITSKVLIIIHSATKMNDIIQKYPPKRTLIWGKGMVKYSWRYNPIFVYQKSDEYKVNKFIWSDTFGIEPIQGKNKAHVYQDPERLYYTILKMFTGIETVLDPFAGSGTTGRACRKLGIDCTLIDHNHEYEKLITNNSMKTMPPLGQYGDV